VQNSKTGYLTLTTPLLGNIFHRQGGTCYGKLMYQIRSLSVHPLRSCEWRCKMQKMGWLGGTQGQRQCCKVSRRRRRPRRRRAPGGGRRRKLSDSSGDRRRTTGDATVGERFSSCITPSALSDHSAVELSLTGKNHASKGPSYWKCNVKILDDSDFVADLEWRILHCRLFQ